MPISWSNAAWLRLPSRIALLLGLGALSAASGPAEGATPQRDTASGAGLADLFVRTEGGRIYLSENGKGFRELRLGPEEQENVLSRLLERGGATDPAGIRLHPTLLAGSGGAGFHWAPANEEGGDEDAAGSGSDRTRTPAARLTKPAGNPGVSNTGTGAVRKNG